MYPPLANQRPGWRLALLLAWLLCAPASAQDERDLGASLPPLLQWAEQHNPELQAVDAELDAAQARVIPAAALPDPMLSIELRDIPSNQLELSPSQVGSTRYQLRQTIPLAGKRDLREALASANASAAESRSQSLRNELRARIRSAFSQLYAANHSYRITQELRDLLGKLESIARSRYASGLAPQQDIISAQAEQTMLRSALIDWELESHHASARLNVALNRPAGAHLAEPKSLPPIPARAFAYAELRDRLLARNPQLQGQTAQTEAARRNQQLVERNRYPDLTVGFAPIQTGNRVDNWELMLEINLPLQQESRRAQEREAAALARSAEAGQAAMSNAVLGEFEETWSRFEASTHQLRLLRDTLLPQLELSFQSALASYQNGKVDFATLLETQRQLRKTRLDMIRAELESQLRVADIERLTGEAL